MNFEKETWKLCYSAVRRNTQIESFKSVGYKPKHYPSKKVDKPTCPLIVKYWQLAEQIVEKRDELSLRKNIAVYLKIRKHLLLKGFDQVWISTKTIWRFEQKK
jgi:hypothetical protein